MMAKKSGLADSPFFRPPSLPSPAPVSDGQVSPLPEVPTSVPVFTNAQTHERTNEQLHEGTSAQTHKRADEQLHERTHTQPRTRTTTQTHERTTAQMERSKSRESYDVYEDPAQAIEELALKWRKERRMHITKGQVMRELLDEILPKKR